MDIDHEKVQETFLALLYLNTFEDWPGLRSVERLRLGECLNLKFPAIEFGAHCAANPFRNGLIASPSSLYPNTDVGDNHNN